MADVTKIKLPDNSEYNLKDNRIPGVDTTPTSGSDNVVTSGGVYDKINEKYTKPSTGIPASDLADNVIPYVENFYFVEGTSSQAGNSTSGSYLSTKWEGQIQGGAITQVYNGLKIAYRIKTNTGVSTAGVVLSIDGINYYPVVIQKNTLVTTHYPVGSTPLMVFNNTQTASAYLTSNTKTTVTGCWQIMEYDSNTNTYQREYVSSGNVEYPITTRYNTTSGESYYAEYGRYSEGVTLNPSTNTITASGFKTTSGTSSQFLKADGSVDSNTYATTSQIPSAVTESTVSGWGFTKNTGTYSKPSGGIPATDLAAGVQTSLDKADSAATFDSVNSRLTGCSDGIKTISGYDGLIYAIGSGNADGDEDCILATTDQIPTESTVSGWGFTKNAGTLTGVSFNGSSATVTNGVASISASTPLIIDVGENPTTAPAGTFAQCQSAILANRLVALMVEDDEDGNSYLYVHQSTGTYYGGNFMSIKFYRVSENYISYYILNSSENLTYGRILIGTLTGVKFNNVDATVSNGVASITATIPAGLPSVSSSDNGKVLTVVSGDWAAATASSGAGTLDTTATTAQTTSASEALSGNVTLHKIAKTGTYSDLIGTPTIPTVPTNVSAFTNDANYVKYVLCADETAYNAISSKDSGTLYLIPKT